MQNTSSREEKRKCPVVWDEHLAMSVAWNSSFLNPDLECRQMGAYFWQTLSSCVPKQNIPFCVLKHLIAGLNLMQVEFHLDHIKMTLSSLLCYGPRNCLASILEIQ